MDSTKTEVEQAMDPIDRMLAAIKAGDMVAFWAPAQVQTEDEATDE